MFRAIPLGLAYVAFAATGVSLGNVGVKPLAGQSDPIMAMGFQLLIGALPLAVLSMLTEDVSLLKWSTEFVLVPTGILPLQRDAGSTVRP